MTASSRGGSLVIALDVGTSSVRALLFDVRASPQPGAEVHLPYRPRVTADGGAEVDARRLLALVEKAVQDLLESAGPQRRRRIAAVGISTFWHGLCGADDAGRPLTPLYLWSDNRSWRQADRLRQALDDEAVRQRTGCLLHPTYWPAKLAWLKEGGTAVWGRRPHWVSIGELLTWRLFGRPLTSLSMASGTGIMLLRERRWDLALLEALEVGPDSLPEVAESARGLGRRHARRWPELAQVPWFTAAGDGALANLGSGCVAPRLRAITIGTSGALRVMTATPPRAIPPGLWCYRLDGERLVMGGALSNGGNLHAWFLKTLALDERGGERWLARMAPGAHGLTFVPLLAGERSPGYAPHATGAVAGLTSATLPEDIVRAGMEAVAIEFARVDALLDLAAPAPEALVASGAALLASPAWMQMAADAVGRRVTVGPAREASSRGAAIRAIEGLGLGRPEEWAGRPGRSFEPRPEATRAYRAERVRQEALYRVLVAERLLDRPLHERARAVQAAAGLG
ncbi:MAG: gluconokinase [Candidatus Dormibacterales bacterium]